jgi:cell wall-associated NlpC family hydrolase
MFSRFSRLGRVSAVLLILLAAPAACAQEAGEAMVIEPTGAIERQNLVDKVVDQASASVAGIQQTLTKALDLIGIRYRRGGTSPETGFDCSGFVGHVFREGLGLYLPHNARQISKSGEVVARNELQPGDLVFFDTMRRAFSHVGIYLGDDKFVHSPRSGGAVRVEDMNDSYWRRRFNGARRIATEQ